MSWLNTVGGLLQQYASDNTRTPETADRDFDEVAAHAPREEMAKGLAEMFRSQQTPAFPSLLGQLFGNANPSMRSSILNTLLSVVGPQVLSSVLARHGGSGLPGQLGAGQHQLNAEEADQVPQSAIEEMAVQAEQRDPGIVDRISDIYAAHPTLVKTLGTAALGIAINHFAKQRR